LLLKIFEFAVPLAGGILTAPQLCTGVAQKRVIFFDFLSATIFYYLGLSEKPPGRPP